MFLWQIYLLHVLAYCLSKTFYLIIHLPTGLWFTQMIQSNQLNQSFNSIYMLTFLENLLFRWPFRENARFRWPVWDILNPFNWFNHSSPSKSIDSVTYFMKTNWLSHLSIHLEKELNRFNQFCGKSELIQVSQLSRVDWYANHVGKGGQTNLQGPLNRRAPFWEPRGPRRLMRGPG